jgi:hypothetical protein
MQSNFSQYAPQGLAPQIPGMQPIGPSQLGNPWLGHELGQHGPGPQGIGQQVPAWAGQFNPFAQNPQAQTPFVPGQSASSSLQLVPVLGAPGIAIVSTVPGGGYVAADGTPAAAAHVSAFAALVLAHHPLFQQEGLFAVRSEQRVQAVLDLIRASAVPHFLDPQYSGAGVPDLARVPGGHTFSVVGLPLAPIGSWRPNQQPTPFYY